MCGLGPSTALQNIEKAGEIGVEIGVRILQRVAHSGLRGKMHHRSEIAVAENCFHGFAIGKVDAVKRKSLKLPQHGKTRLFERRIIIGIEIVDTDDRAAAFENTSRQRKADKDCGAGDQKWIL